MSTLLTKRQPKASSATVVPSLPQVNLLPPSVHAKRALGRTKRLLAYALVGVLVLCGAGWFYATSERSSQEQRLADAQAETVRLTKAQAKYQEAPKVLFETNLVDQARTQGFSTDITWRPYLMALVSTLPDGAKLKTVSYNGATPMLAPAEPTDPLQGASQGQIAFTATSENFVDAVALVASLAKVPGFADPWATSIKVTGKDAGGAAAESYYEITGTVQVTDEAFSGRFAEGSK